MSLNKHWPEPIEVNADPDTQGDFYVEEIIRAVYDEDGNKLRELRGDDEEGYSVLHRTAYRLENCYNACAGLNIQSDTNLKDVLEQAIHSLLTEEDVKYTAKLLQSLIAKNILED